MADAFAVVRQFEADLCAYTGAPYAVAVNSCSAALLLACAWAIPRVKMPAYGDAYWDTHRRDAALSVSIPRRTYVSVPMAIVHAGGRPTFRDEDWSGAYELRPLNVWDSARWFTSGLWTRLGGLVCVSFHHSKTLGDTQGGAILHDSPEADTWLRRARFDGRTEGVAPAEDVFDQLGWHCYMSPDVAARLIWRLSKLPIHNAPLPNDAYPDLSLAPLFR